MRLFAPSLLLAAAQALLVPPPPGPYSVDVKNIELMDANRIDPFAPEAGTKRRFMASVYLPVDVQYGCEPYVVPYMPPLTANAYGKAGVTLGLPQDMLAKFEMEFCNISSLTVDVETKKQEFPVAVLSPGLNGSRFLYGALARSLASLGYIIFTVDHTYDALVVEFPDGSAAYSLTGDLGANTTLNDPGLEVFQHRGTTPTLNGTKKANECRIASAICLSSFPSSPTKPSQIPSSPTFLVPLILRK